jgi:hypothetical protein
MSKKRSMMEQYRISKKQSGLILFLTCIIHLIIFIMVFHHHPHEWQKILPMLDQNEYLVQQILSSGQQPATVLFQDEAELEPQMVKAEDDITQALEPSEDMQETMKQQEQTNRSDVVTVSSSQEDEPTAIKPRRHKKKVTKRDNVTMTQISQGFIKSAQQEAGYNNAARDMKQLALEVYASKVWNLIKNAFLVGDSCLHLPQSIDAQTQLALTINREGTLVDIKLIYPKEITELQNVERLLINRAKQAGLFPPFSAQMQGETQRFSFPLRIKGEQGFHTYALSCQ